MYAHICVWCVCVCVCVRIYYIYSERNNECNMQSKLCVKIARLCVKIARHFLERGITKLFYKTTLIAANFIYGNSLTYLLQYLL